VGLGSNTATDGAASSGSRAAIGAATTPGNVAINANPSVVLSLSRSDDYARRPPNTKLDGDIEVQRNRARTSPRSSNRTVADGSQTSLQRAIDFFHGQYDRIDPSSRATIDTALRRRPQL